MLPKNRSLWFPLFVLCCGAFFLIIGIFEKVTGRGGGPSKGAQFVTWEQDIAAGILAIAGSIYVISTAKKTEPNQAPEPTSTAVTPPAVAGDRASGARGSS